MTDTRPQVELYYSYRSPYSYLAIGRLKRWAEPRTCIDIIEANQQAHREAGHWGVPTMVFEGEPFFGQDRIDLLQWRVGRRRAGGAG